jgi:hypothetical protein
VTARAVSGAVTYPSVSGGSLRVTPRRPEEEVNADACQRFLNHGDSTKAVDA